MVGSVLLRVTCVIALCGAVLANAPSSGSGMKIVTTNYDPAPTAGAPATGSAGAATPVANTKSPIIVDSLADAKNQAQHSEPPKGWPPLDYPNNDEHQWVHQLKTVQAFVHQHQTGLNDLNKQLEEMKSQRAKLLHAQKLLHSMVALHQSEQVLHALDGHIVKIKAKIKALGDKADDIIRGRDDTKKELEDQMKELEDKLAKLRGQLKHHEATLTALSSKRDEVAGTVGEWRQFVADLRARAGLAPKGDSITVPELPRPPAEGEAGEEAIEAEEVKEEEKKEEAAEEDKEEKKAPVEEIKGEETEEKVDTSDITAKDHEVAATKNSIDELLNVHLPRIAGIKTGAAAPAPAAGQQSTSFVEEGLDAAVRVNRRHLRHHGKHHHKH